MLSSRMPESRHTESGFTAYHIPILVLVSIGAMAVALFRMESIVLGWRPTDLASIALNYYRNGFHFFYPQINWGGNGPGFVEMEFPIIPYTVALMYRVAGVHEWLTLLIPMASGLGLVIVMYRFARLVFDPAVGFAAGLFAAISPTLVGLSTGLWPDPPMTFCGALGLWALAIWVTRDSRPWFFVGAFAIAGAILLKITALYIGIPVLFLCIVKHRSAWWRKGDVWLLGLLALAPPTLWYWHAFALYREYQATAPLDVRENMAKSFACRSAVKAGDRLSEPEMRSLIEQLLVAQMPYVCPHGRPVMLRISTDELDRRFGRT